MVGLPAYADQEEEDSEEEEDTDEQPPQATAAAIPPDSKEATEARRIMLMPQSGGLESRCMDGSSGPSMVHPRKGLWGFPLYKTGYSLKQKVVVEERGDKHASQLTSHEKQASFLAAWWLWSFPRGRKYETKGLAHLTSQLS